MRRIYKVINKEGQEEIRITGNHPDIGNYVVRSSKIIKKERALKLCISLNQMVYEREGIGDRFTTSNYKGGAMYVVMRKALPGDLLMAIDV